jgi:hypothetical protein
MLAPEVTPGMVGLGRRPLFDPDWDREIRTLGRELAGRRHFAGAGARRERNAGFEGLAAAITRFVEKPPHRDGDWHKHPGLEAWRSAREALMTDPDAPLPALPR